MPRFSPHRRLVDLQNTKEVETFNEAIESSDSAAAHTVLSTQSSHPTISQKILDIYKRHQDPIERITILEKELANATKFKYVLHNEIARLAFYTQDYDKCAKHIIDAKSLVDSNPNKEANSHYKGAVYYNYSKFII